MARLCYTRSPWAPLTKKRPCLHARSRPNSQPQPQIHCRTQSQSSTTTTTTFAALRWGGCSSLSPRTPWAISSSWAASSSGVSSIAAEPTAQQQQQQQQHQQAAAAKVATTKAPPELEFSMEEEDNSPMPTSLQDAMRALHSEDLVNLALHRAHLAKRYHLSVHVSFANSLVAELQHRRLQIMKAARLAEAIVDLGVDEGVVPLLLPLCESAAQGGRGGGGQGRSRQLEASALLQALARLRSRVGAAAGLGPLATQIMPLFEAFFRAPPEYLRVPAIATVLESADRLECQLTGSQIEAAEIALVMGLTSAPKAHARFGEAVSRLGRQGSDLKKVNTAIVDKLFEAARKGEDEGMPVLDNLLWQVRVQFQTVEKPVLEYGLTEVICERLQTEFHTFNDEALFLFATRIREMRALREEYWDLLGAETLRRMPMMEADVAVGLGRLIIRASIVSLEQKAALLQAMVKLGDKWLPSISPTNLAGLLDTVASRVEPSQFLETFARPNAEALRQRLLKKEELGLEYQAVLAGLANGGGRSIEVQALWPSWWRDLVIRPWAGELRQFGRTLQAGPSGCGGRAEYVARMEDTVLGDVRELWSPVFMKAMGFGRAPEPDFLRRALRNTLRRRRKTPCDDVAAGTAMGYVDWSLCVKNYGLDRPQKNQGHVVRTNISVEEGLELQSVASKMHEEIDGGLLQPAQVGFLEKRYRRHGDVERVALLRVLAGLRSTGLGRLLMAQGSGGMAKFSGVVNIYVDRVTCLSCLGCMLQFQRAFPGIEIRIACAFPPWLSRKLSKRQLTGFSRDQGSSQAFQRTLTTPKLSGYNLGVVI